MQQATSNATRECLNKICQSDAFSGSKRLQELLIYVVEEELAGRGHDIRAKTIGLDVHGYSPEEILERESVVRVDAGRVRRKLEDYYREASDDDEIQISLPVGTYRPEIRNSRSEGEKRRPWFATFAWLLAVVGLTSLVLLVFGVFQRDAAVTERHQEGLDLIFDISPARVEAANLSEVGRDLIFPALDPNRLRLALNVFEETISKDTNYFGGYAGAAQVYATMALLVRDKETAGQSLELAQKFSKQANVLQPEAAWSLSAAAWVQFASGEPIIASELSARALEISPSDPHVIEFDSLIALYTGNFVHIFEQSKARQSTAVIGQNFVFQNVLGSALFHIGDYATSISVIEDAIAEGAPFGPVTVSYLMAAHHMLGNDVKAAELARLFNTTWPTADVLRIKKRLFVDAPAFDQLAEALHAIQRTDSQ